MLNTERVHRLVQQVVVAACRKRLPQHRKRACPVYPLPRDKLVEALDAAFVEQNVTLLPRLQSSGETFAWSTAQM